MGALQVVYNVASNKPPRYRDDPDESDSYPPNRDHGSVETFHDDPLPPGSYPGDADDTYTSNKKWTSYLARHIPQSLRTAWRNTVDWTAGPKPPRPWSIKPFFPRIQTAPIRFMDTYFPRPIQRFSLLILLYFIWLLTFSLVLRKSAFASDIPGYGSPERISCGTSFWAAKNGCDLNGSDCRPFTNYTMPFRCPANCLKTKALNPHAVGDQNVIYRPVVIGGANSSSTDPVRDGIYRGDSFVCGSAIHAGFISNTQGGCGVLQLVGLSTDFPSTSRNGIESVAFPSSFPRNFAFIPGATSTCTDLRWPLLALTATVLAILSIFTTSPPVFFFSTFTILFIHVALVSDPPNGSYTHLISTMLGKLVPSCFAMAIMYHFAIRRTLTNLTAQFEKTALWLGSAWIGALNNETFDRIPIARLTPHDIHQQPGAVPALIFVVLSIFTIALGQAWAIRVEGKMRTYLALYAILVGSLLLLLTIPGFNLRIHHYIIGLLLLPGTALQNRPCLVYQGLLVGLFINGIARWGWDSILQTPAELLGDGQLGTALPVVLPPLMAGAKNITFSWPAPPPPSDRSLGEGSYDGISVLVNDVERYRGYFDEIGDGAEWTYTRPPIDIDNPEYFRFGYVQGSGGLDYTKAGIWGADGVWTQMVAGPSR